MEIRDGIIVLILSAGSFSCRTAGESAVGVKSRYANDGYHLIWAEEFNRSGKPDTTFWSYENGFVRNEEAQWYQENNARCKGGLLIIEGRKGKKEQSALRSRQPELGREQANRSIYFRKHQHKR